MFWVAERGRQTGPRHGRDFSTHTDELHVHFGVLLHVLQQVHVEGLSLQEAKGAITLCPSPYRVLQALWFGLSCRTSDPPAT